MLFVQSVVANPLTVVQQPRTRTMHIETNVNNGFDNSYDSSFDKNCNSYYNSGCDNNPLSLLG